MDIIELPTPQTVWTHLSNDTKQIVDLKVIDELIHQFAEKTKIKLQYQLEAFPGSAKVRVIIPAEEFAYQIVIRTLDAFQESHTPQELLSIRLTHMSEYASEIAQRARSLRESEVGKALVYARELQMKGNYTDAGADLMVVPGTRKLEAKTLQPQRITRQRIPDSKYFEYQCATSESDHSVRARLTHSQYSEP